MSLYFGKYRGTVINNLDTENRGRLQVSVPAVFGEFTLNWAEPCVPYAGINTGFYAMPPVGAKVWVEFEGGNQDRPIWSGCFWGTGETPALAFATPATIPHVLVQTAAQTMFQLSDKPGPDGGIILKTAAGAMILINDTGITISNGKGATILMTQNSVSINGVALVIQ
ncbi:MAG: phage baseplate assembly protein V [Acidobacteriota bacterium]|nr:phage baseplate assembly protein V [Acidobacteriota bacterium]